MENKTKTEPKNKKVFSNIINIQEIPPSYKEGGGSTARFFYQLYDAPSSYEGETGKILAVNSDETALEFVVGGSIFSVTEVSTNTTITSYNVAYEVNATSGYIIMTLPTAVGNSGKSIIIKNVSTDTGYYVQINPPGAETIDGYSSGDIHLKSYIPNEVFTLTSNGTNWKIYNYYKGNQ
ncbi:MAG: hypothetical protein PHT54_03510 [Candidatus Nanoarchaeia archaeon]|nr:hypothetical protein [Candidatus Nanoarchaeia archaeon]